MHREAGTVLSMIGRCSPVIYDLFITGVISSTVIPFLPIIPFVSALLLTTAIYLLVNRIEKTSIGTTENTDPITREIC